MSTSSNSNDTGPEAAKQPITGAVRTSKTKTDSNIEVEAGLYIEQTKPGAKPKYHVIRAGAKRPVLHPARDPAATFWHFAVDISSAGESTRLDAIRIGYEPDLVFAVRAALSMSVETTESFFNLSMSTLERRLRTKERLGMVASERLDRVALIAKLAEDVFEDKAKATEWLSRPNMALGDQLPVHLCETEIGATQVRRVLHAIEWGNPA